MRKRFAHDEQFFIFLGNATIDTGEAGHCFGVRLTQHQRAQTMSDRRRAAPRDRPLVLAWSPRHRVASVTPAVIAPDARAQPQHRDVVVGGDPRSRCRRRDLRHTEERVSLEREAAVVAE